MHATTTKKVLESRERERDHGIEAMEVFQPSSDISVHLFSRGNTGIYKQRRL